MQVLVLGCGASVGVPSVSCDCFVCTSDNKKNKRLRSSILIKLPECDVLIDSSPDLRYQAIKNSITKVGAVIFTHKHFDHCAGINEIANFEQISSDSSIPIYSDDITIKYLIECNSHLFKKVDFNIQKKNYLTSHIRNYYEAFKIHNSDYEFILMKQKHGEILSSGILVGNFAYCTDFSYIEDQSLELLQKANLEVIIIECLRYSKSLAHANFTECLDWLSKIKPKRAFLTHMSHEIEYETINQELIHYSKQLGIKILPSYDGMVIDV